MQNKMKKLLHWFNGIKLRYKLAIFYSLFCFLPVMLLFWLSFLQMRSLIDDKGKMNLQLYLQQSVSSIDQLWTAITACRIILPLTGRWQRYFPWNMGHPTSSMSS